jgi:hypothetical protein
MPIAMLVLRSARIASRRVDAPGASFREEHRIFRCVAEGPCLPTWRGGASEHYMRSLQRYVARSQCRRCLISINHSDTSARITLATGTDLDGVNISIPRDQH